MSPTSGVRRVAPAPPSPDHPIQTRLRVVPHRTPQPSRVTFVVCAVTAMAAGLVGLLLLNIAMQSAAFELAGLNSQAEDLHIRQQALDLEVDRLASPDQLALRASAQGMVPNKSPVFLDLSSGKVIGTPTPAAAGTGLTEFNPVVEPAREPHPRDPQTRDSHTRSGERQDGGGRP